MELSELEKQSAIETCIRFFDFKRVHDTMLALNWSWRGDKESPSIGELVIKAIDQMRDTIKGAEKTGREYIISSGGIKVIAKIEENENPKLYLNLMFCVSDSDNTF